MSHTAVILPDLESYQQQLAVVEGSLGDNWQPQAGCTNGTNYIIILPAGQNELIPDTYPRTSDYQDYWLVVPEILNPE